MLKSQSLQSWDWEIDGDGVLTRIEYFAGTDPFDPLSTVTASILQAKDGFGVSWNSLPGTRFQLLSPPGLVTWQPLGDLAVAG